MSGSKSVTLRLSRDDLAELERVARALGAGPRDRSRILRRALWAASQSIPDCARYLGSLCAAHAGGAHPLADCEVTT